MAIEDLNFPSYGKEVEDVEHLFIRCELLSGLATNGTLSRI